MKLTKTPIQLDARPRGEADRYPSDKRIRSMLVTRLFDAGQSLVASATSTKSETSSEQMIASLSKWSKGRDDKRKGDGD